VGKLKTSSERLEFKNRTNTGVVIETGRRLTGFPPPQQRLCSID